MAQRSTLILIGISLLALEQVRLLKRSTRTPEACGVSGERLGLRDPCLCPGVASLFIHQQRRRRTTCVTRRVSGGRERPRVLRNITLGSFFGRPRSFKTREAGMAGMPQVQSKAFQKWPRSDIHHQPPTRTGMPHPPGPAMKKKPLPVRRNHYWRHSWTISPERCRTFDGGEIHH